MTAVWHYIWPQPEKWRRSPRGFILYPFSPHRLALFSFSHSPTQSAIQISSSVQPSVSIPIPDRPTGHAQVACPSCREWQTANIPQWTGFSCLIPIAAFFFFPKSVVRLLGPDPCVRHSGDPKRAVVLSRGPLCPSPSTFASVEHSIYFIAPLHLIALTSHIPGRVMRWLCWCQPQCCLGRSNHPVGGSRRSGYWQNKTPRTRD